MCWIEEARCQSRWLGKVRVSTECCPDIGCNETDCRSMLKAARRAYKAALENIAKPSQASFEGRSVGNYRPAKDLEVLRKEIDLLEAECPDPPELNCTCINGCMKCKPKMTRPGPMNIRIVRRH